MKKELDLSIEGMHCESCEKIIKEVLLEKDGVKSVNVNAKTGEGVVTFDDKKVSKDEIKNLIEAENYKVNIDNEKELREEHAANQKSAMKPTEEKKEINANKRVSLSLTGMHCASCAGIIER